MEQMDALISAILNEEIKNANPDSNDINNNLAMGKAENDDSQPDSASSPASRAESESHDLAAESSRGPFVESLLTFFSRGSGETEGLRTPEVLSKLPPIPFLGGRPLSKKEPTQKSLNLINFITAGMVNNLKNLGVDDLDCNECVDVWLTHRRQKRWKQSMPVPKKNFLKYGDSHPCFDPTDLSSNATNPVKRILNTYSKPEALNGFSPSDPDNSILRISESGNEELGQFLSRMEEVRTHLNDASCTLLQTQMILILPYFKLLTGNQLETSNHEKFVTDWIQILLGMVAELKPSSLKEAEVMLSREYKYLHWESTKLYECISKLYKKAGDLHKENEKRYKKFLGRLHPRSLTVRSRVEKKNKDQTASTLMNNAFLSEKVQFAPVPLNRLNATVTELLQNHLFFSKASDDGRIIFRKELKDNWENFEDLPFQRKREFLLTTIEDLHGALKSSTTTATHVQELFIKGYPESVCSKIRENLAYLKKVSKKNELLVLSKHMIATHVKAFLESLSRLVRTLKDTMEISKLFYKNIKKNSSKFKPTPSASITTFRDQDTSSQATAKIPTMTKSQRLMFDTAKVKLLVPYPMSPGPIQDQFFLPILE